MLAYWLRPGLIRSPYMRLNSILAGVVPVMIAHALTREPDITEGYIYPIIILVLLIYYDLALEWRFTVSALALIYAALLISQHLIRPHYAYLDGFPVMKTLTGVLLVKVVFIIFGLLSLRLFSQKDEERYRLTLEQENRIAEQEALLTELEALQAESESRRQEAEARYAEAQKLQKELAREVARTTLTARYEALMRDQYGKSLPDFLRALLEYLHDDLNFVAGLAYQVKDKTYEVVATFALPQYQGQTFSGGLLETATALKKTYLVAIPPRTLHLKILATLKPQYALYLPISAEIARSQVVAVVELLFLSKPDSEKIPNLDALLPRIGTYIWMQLKSLNHV